MSKMIKCKTCGADIASGAKTCPSCGAKNKKTFYKRWWFILIVFFIVVGALGSSGSKPKKVSSSADSSSASTDTTVSTDSSKKSNAPEIYKIGDTIQLKDFKVTVNKIRSASSGSNKMFKPKDGNEFFFVDCTIENTSDKDQTVSSILMFKVVDKDGRSYDQSISGDNNGQLDGTVGPTRKISGEYCVEVPNGKAGLELEFNSSFINNQQIVVELN
jgi:hypothetical protein